MSEDLYHDTLGIPIPSPESYRVLGKLIPKIIDQIGRRFDAPGYIFPRELQDIIFLSLSFHSPDEWKAKFSRAAKSAIKFSPTIERLSKTIEAGLLTPEVAKAYKKINPAFSPDPVIVRPMPTPAQQKITPEPTTTPGIGATLKKVISKIPKRKFPTVTEYILFHAPSKSYELIYSTTLACCRNKRSSKGKKVYPYGQAYIAKLTRLSRSTVDRAWSYLRKKGIFNKARNENHKEHHCSLWYVCTSMKQIPYFRDPENRHRKSKRQN
jgi:hypothetical protein